MFADDDLADQLQIFSINCQIDRVFSTSIRYKMQLKEVIVLKSHKMFIK